MRKKRISTTRSMFDADGALLSFREITMGDLTQKSFSCLASERIS